MPAVYVQRTADKVEDGAGLEKDMGKAELHKFAPDNRIRGDLSIVCTESKSLVAVWLGGPEDGASSPMDLEGAVSSNTLQ